MTEREVAAWLRVSVLTVRKWRYEGSGPPYYKVGRSVRYKESHVADWADNTIVYPQALDELLEKQGKEDPYYSGVKVE